MNAYQIHRFSKTETSWTGDDMAVAKTVLGGKGAGLALMCRKGLPVPPGFTITTSVCNEYRGLPEGSKEKFLDDLMLEVDGHMQWLDTLFGYRPLVSVRSGAPVSMPGMMDTILNVGLCSANWKEWGERLGARALHDTDRRLTQMLGATAYGVPAEVFEFQLAKVKKAHKVKADTDLDVVGLSEVIDAYRKAFEENKGFKFPFDNPREQLRAAIQAVFDSWMNERAIEYRRLNGISEDMGTAVNVQAMVFGNTGELSGSGVLFTRDPSTGEPKIMGEYLENAQGEDVVAGIRTPKSLSTYLFPTAEGYLPSCSWAAGLVDICSKLEEFYRDMVDVEFTVQNGELFILQSRVGKRSARAAFRIATDLADEGVIAPTDVLSRLTSAQFRLVKRPTVDPSFAGEPTLKGLPACPGVAVGKAVFSKEEALASVVPCILVTEETTPDDIAGMAKAVGVLTKTGGATSHAAVVARSMDKPCIVGAGDLEFHMPTASVAGKDVAFDQSTTITIDGSTGRVWIGVDVPVVDASEDAAIAKVGEIALAALGVLPLAPTGEIPDLLSGKAVIVSARANWGDTVYMNRVLDVISQLSFRKHIVLDLQPPMLEFDGDLISIFGEDPRLAWAKELAAIMNGRVADYAGCTVLWPASLGAEMPAAVHQAQPLLYSATIPPTAVPVEYAIFLALAS